MKRSWRQRFVSSLVMSAISLAVILAATVGGIVAFAIHWAVGLAYLVLVLAVLTMEDP